MHHPTITHAAALIPSSEGLSRLLYSTINLAVEVCASSTTVIFWSIQKLYVCTTNDFILVLYIYCLYVICKVLWVS